MLALQKDFYFLGLFIVYIIMSKFGDRVFFALFLSK